jgi:hypothetical protein
MISRRGFVRALAALAAVPWVKPLVAALPTRVQALFPLRDYGLSFEVTETVEDALRQKARFLAFSIRQMREKQMAAILSNGFSEPHGMSDE